MKMSRAWLVLLGVLATVFVPISANAQDSPGNCKLSSAKGAFGFSENGSILGFGLYASVGTIVSDGAGNMKGVFTESAGGIISSGITFVGTYVINQDCTGTAVLTDSLGRVGHRAFVLVDQGKEFHYLFSDPGFIATGVAKKQ